MWKNFKKWFNNRIKIPSRQDPRTWYINRPLTGDPHSIPVGAIILFSHRNFTVLGWAIKWWTNAEVNHAAVSIGNGEIVEAAPEGVIKCSINKYLNDNDMLWIYDCADATDGQRQQIKASALTMVGNPYDYREIAGIAIGHQENTPGHNICSEVAGISYKVSGLRASDVDTDKVVPGDIQNYAQAHPQQRPLWAVQNVKEGAR
jgi:uncharacterized protein YycO